MKEFTAGNDYKVLGTSEEIDTETYDAQVVITAEKELTA